MEDLDYMKEALALAREAKKAGEVPVAALLYGTARWWAGAGTAGKREETPCATRRSRPSTMPAGPLEDGGYGSAPCM